MSTKLGRKVVLSPAGGLHKSYAVHILNPLVIFLSNETSVEDMPGAEPVAGQTEKLTLAEFIYWVRTGHPGAVICFEAPYVPAPNPALSRAFTPENILAAIGGQPFDGYYMPYSDTDCQRTAIAFVFDSALPIIFPVQWVEMIEVALEGVYGLNRTTNSTNFDHIRGQAIPERVHALKQGLAGALGYPMPLDTVKPTATTYTAVNSRWRSGNIGCSFAWIPDTTKSSPISEGRPVSGTVEPIPSLQGARNYAREHFTLAAAHRAGSQIEEHYRHKFADGGQATITIWWPA